MAIYFSIPIDDDGYQHECNEEEQKLIECPTHGENCRAEKCKGCDKVISDCGEFC